MASRCPWRKVKCVGILGPNGSGKTTLLKVLSGILHGRGEVKLNGQSIQRYGRRELSKLFAVVPQESTVNFPYTVAEIVMMGRACYHSAFALESKEDIDVARASMELTDSLLLSDRYLHELSGGEKQRVMIARALAQQPEVLLLDEPSAFLDLKHQVQVFELLRRLNWERGLTIVAALHDLNLAALFFPRLLMLREGEIYCDGTPIRSVDGKDDRGSLRYSGSSRAQSFRRKASSLHLPVVADLNPFSDWQFYSPMRLER